MIRRLSKVKSTEPTINARKFFSRKLKQQRPNIPARKEPGTRLKIWCSEANGDNEQQRWSLQLYWKEVRAAGSAGVLLRGTRVDSAAVVLAKMRSVDGRRVRARSRPDAARVRRIPDSASKLARPIVCHIVSIPPHLPCAASISGSHINRSLISKIESVDKLFEP